MKLKRPSKLNQAGFHVIELVIVLAVISVIGFVGFRVMSQDGGLLDKKTGDSSDSEKNKADANGLVDAQSLECVPRGHDYFRTNNSLAVDPEDSSVVYVGVEYKGVFKSTDGGSTWKQSDKGIRGYPKEQNAKEKCIQELGRTVIDPKDNKHLLISRVESPGDLSTLFSENAGVWESKDAGASWKQLIKPGMNASGSRAIAFDPNDSKTIYHGTNNMSPSFTGSNGEAVSQELFNKDGILYQSSNGGKDWKELPTGAPKGFRAVNVAVDPQDSKKIWLFTFTSGENGQPEQSKQKSVIVSNDAGKTWKSIADSLPEGYKVLTNGLLSPVDGNNAYLMTASTSSQPKSFYTVDGGNSWLASSVYTFAADFDPTDPTGHRLLGYAPYENQAGIYQSNDGGKTWDFLSSLPAEVDNSGDLGVRIEGFAWSQSDRNTVYMSGSGAMVWKSTDAGKTWKTVMSLDTVGGPNKNKEGSTKSREQEAGHN